MDKIDILLTRGVDKIYPSKEILEKVLRSGKKIRLYQGFDPTSPYLHIGHLVGLKKMRQFQELGHEVIFLIGDFTGMVGDPSGKTTERKQLTKEQVLENAKTYKEQAAKILKFDGENPVLIKYNSEWLGKLSAIEFFRLSHSLTYQQVVERDMFQERIKQGQDIFMNEFLYPFMQGYDSVAMDVDLEIGGSDQMFNMLMGRKLMRNLKHKEKFVVTTPLLTDASGKKIGKTEGNVIGLTDAPNEFYAKIMSLGDDAIIPCFTLLTDEDNTEIENIKQAIKKGENPMLYKKRLAFELTKMLNSQKEAEIAQDNFSKTFQTGDLSAVMEFEIKKLPNNPIPIIDLLTSTQTATSRGDARRLIEQSAVEIDQTVVDMVQTNVTLKSGMTLRVGKRKFLKFI